MPEPIVVINYSDMIGGIIVLGVLIIGIAVYAVAWAIDTVRA